MPRGGTLGRTGSGLRNRRTRYFLVGDDRLDVLLDVNKRGRASAGRRRSGCPYDSRARVGELLVLSARYPVSEAESRTFGSATSCGTPRSRCGHVKSDAVSNSGHAG